MPVVAYEVVAELAASAGCSELMELHFSSITDPYYYKERMQFDACFAITAFY